MEDELVPRLPVNRDSIKFNDWIIEFEKSHILKSICVLGPNKCCPQESGDCCEVCTYRYKLELPHLPDMVFHKNQLILSHIDGGVLQFMTMDALHLVENGKQLLQVACADEWKETRPDCHTSEKFKPFDWTFTTDYQGTLNSKFRTEKTDMSLNKFKLMQRERIMFYHELTLFEDELHDNGISQCSVKIRVMPSGFYILLRHFLRVDNVLVKMHDTRFHYEIENDYILKEFSKREATYNELINTPPAFFTEPNQLETYLPIKHRENFKLFFK